MKEIIITEKDAGGRLDKAIFRFLDKASTGFIYKMLRKKNIVLNDKKSEGKEILKAGDVIKLYLSEDTIKKFQSESSVNRQKKADNKSTLVKLIVFEDDNILAMNKPSGLLSQKVKPDDRSLNDELCDYLKKTDLFKPGISNRLDRNTSGLVLAGKTPNAVRLLNRGIKERQLSKKYLCIVEGKVLKKAEIEGYLSKDEGRNTVTVSDMETDGASFIKTIYRPLDHNDKYSLLEVDLITGKSHQIRAHLSSIGHPIIGDEKYGNKNSNVLFRLKYSVNSQLLHSYRVEFNELEDELSYLNGQVIECNPPKVFTDVMKGERLCLHGTQED